MKYADQLKTKEWKARRLEILERDNHTCTQCGSKENLHVHHLYYRKTKMAWEYPDKALTTLCKSCHEDEHPEIFDGEITVTMRYKFTGNEYRFIKYIQVLKRRQSSTSAFDFKVDKACSVLKITLTQLSNILDKLISLQILQKAGKGKLKSFL